MISKNQKPPTAAESLHMERIKAMQCICCELLDMTQVSHTDCHHIRKGREERNHWLTIPLCHDGCHQGPGGVHGDQTYLHMLKMSEYGLLAHVIERLEA